MKRIIITLTVALMLLSCKDSLAPVAADAIKATVITEPTPNDTDDPAIWVHPTNPSKSLIVGTDKEVGGGVYVYDLNGKIVNKFIGMQRPNNVDIAYGLKVGDTVVDVAVVTERNSNQLRVFSMPDLKPIDGGGLAMFEGETEEDYRDVMGIALYTHQQGTEEQKIYAVVGRKSGPSSNYLWQYELKGKEDGTVEAKKVRAFGTYSGKKEIEAIAVDNELGYIYYSDEMAGVRKYYADPFKGNEELAFFATTDAKRDHEGIAIYKTGAQTGYILVSDQQENNFLVYAREGKNGNPHQHELLAKIPVSTIECDGADASNANFGPPFEKGMLVAMSNGNVFHYYKWEDIQARIDAGIQQPKN